MLHLTVVVQTLYMQQVHFTMHAERRDTRTMCWHDTTCQLARSAYRLQPCACSNVKMAQSKLVSAWLEQTSSTSQK
jgi:hypothetical protein